MSLDPILWALKDAPVADSLERLVLVVLGEHAGSADGCTAFPSRDTIASLVLADPKTVQRVIARLIKRGLIARGDQSAARYIRADRRPVVYDLLIPYSWFPNPGRMNEERRKRGLPPLTPKDRPDIAPAPARARRKDLGVPRKKGERGDSESPRQDRRQTGHGGTENPARGDSQSRTGGLEDPRTTYRTPSVNPPSPASGREPAPDGRRPTTGSRERATGGFAASSKTQPAHLTPRQGKQIQAVLRMLPARLTEALPDRTPQNVKRAIIDALATDDPAADRTPEQLVRHRVMPRWDKHWAMVVEAGELKSAVGALVAMLAPGAKCGSPRCDERTDVDTGQPCPLCATARADRTAAREHPQPTAPQPSPAVPEPRPARPRCPECERPLANATTPELCRDCREEQHAYA